MSYNRHSTYHYSLPVLYLLAVSLLCLEHKLHEDRRPLCLRLHHTRTAHSSVGTEQSVNEWLLNVGWLMMKSHHLSNP